MKSDKKVILITGASSGIGKATAIYFASKGWNVAATMREIQYNYDERRSSEVAWTGTNDA